MANVMTTDVRRWRLMWFSCLLWQSTDVCNLSAAHKNAAIPSGPCGSLYMEADTRTPRLCRVLSFGAQTSIVLPKMQEFYFFSRSSKYAHILNKDFVSQKITEYFSVLKANYNRIKLILSGCQRLNIWKFK